MARPADEMMKKEEGRLVRVDRVPMRWGEMDALGHMNNVSYFRYFEQARISWFDSLKIDYSPDSEGPILGTITCKFISPAIYPADLEITTYVGKPGGSSFKMFHEMYLAGDPATLYAEAGAVMVWIGIGDGKSRPLPDWIREQLPPHPGPLLREERETKVKGGEGVDTRE